MHNVHTLSAASLHIIDEGWNMEYENSFYFGDSIWDQKKGRLLLW